jgi:hypothetical protein
MVVIQANGITLYYNNSSKAGTSHQHCHCHCHCHTSRTGIKQWMYRLMIASETVHYSHESTHLLCKHTHIQKLTGSLIASNLDCGCKCSLPNTRNQLHYHTVDSMEVFITLRTFTYFHLFMVMFIYLFLDLLIHLLILLIDYFIYYGCLMNPMNSILS